MKLIIQDELPTMTVRIYGEVQRENKRCIIGYDGEHLVEQELSNDPVMNEKELKPLLIIPRNYFHDIVTGFAEYAQKNDIRTENQHLLEGKLIATEKHLSDMQDFAKKLLESKLRITPKT